MDIIKKLRKCYDSYDPEAFLTVFDHKMEEAGEDIKNWTKHLIGLHN